ncbi:MAG: hypothetical protein ACO1OQ_05560 [Rufibacter sp.]
MRKYLETKLLVRLFMFTNASVAMSLLLGYNLWEHRISLALSFAGVGSGALVGLLVGRLSHLHWHQESEKVKASMDRISLITLVCYLLFTFSKRWLFGHWLHGPVLTAFSFSILLGVMGARLFSTHQKIRGILREQGIYTRLG